MPWTWVRLLKFQKINSIDVAAFLAGNDILLIPNDIKKATKKMKRAFKQGKFRWSPFGAFGQENLKSESTK